MTHFRRSAVFAALVLCAVDVFAVPALAPDTATARCQVWARELSFAKSIADHDPTAFAEHVQAHAAFGVGRKPTLGRAAIVDEWEGIVDGSAVALEWYPDVVTQGGDGTLVYSSGPALFRDPASGEYRRSRFGSVWQRDQDGAWRVVFDDGSAPLPADPAAVQAFREGRRDRCSAA